MAQYVAVPAADIIQFLEGKGFTQTSHGNEVVFERSHDKNSQVKVKVYTSIALYRSSVRRRGGDSIKVCTVLETARKTYGLGRFPRVHRVGSTQAVLDRVLHRMREAYARGTEWIEKNPTRGRTGSEKIQGGGYSTNVKCKSSPLDEL